VTRSDVLFAQLETGSLDAALVELRELDAWRLAHPATQIVATGYTHSTGFNIGYVGLSTSDVLLRQVDAIITNLLADGSLRRLAAAASTTWLPPQPPNVRDGVTLGLLRGD